MDIGIGVNAKISSEDQDQIIGDLFRLLGTEAQIRLYPNLVNRLSDAEMVSGLRGVVRVELEAARDMERNDYVAGRIGAYEFVLDAIERRWPADHG